MKYLVIFIFLFLLFACSNSKSVYWCGDHACINNEEKESYFKKTMIVEMRELGKNNKKGKSEFETIIKQAGLEQKKEIKNKKELSKLVKLEKKRDCFEQKGFHAKMMCKLSLKKDGSSGATTFDKPKKEKNVPLTKKNVINTDIAKISIVSTKFSELMENITKKNMLRPYPNINDIPN